MGSEPKQAGKEGAPFKDHLLNSRDHQLKKISKDLDHPHTLDRKSGTGQSAFEKKDKKGGAGRFNKGNYKDDIKRKEGEKEEFSGDEESPKEEEDTTVTWDDYLAKTASGETKQQVNDTKLKVTDDQLKKELGKATLLQTRKDVQIDEHTETVKKGKTGTVVGMNTEHAELLGFRTGFKTFDTTKRRERKPEDKPADKPAEKDGETKTEATTEEKKGEEKPAEDTKPEGESPNGQKGGYKGGYKGDKGGYKGGYKGDKGGYKGDKGGYKPKGEKKITFNAEDESLFPKLG